MVGYRYMLDEAFSALTDRARRAIVERLTRERAVLAGTLAMCCKAQN